MNDLETALASALSRNETLEWERHNYQKENASLRDLLRTALGVIESAYGRCNDDDTVPCVQCSIRAMLEDEQ